MPNSVSNETQRQPKPVRKLFYVFYLLITFGIAAGTIISILRAERWLFATIAALIPYGVFFLLAFFLHPIFRRLCNRTGGIILLAYLICGILVISKLAALLYFAVVLGIGILILRLVGIFAPDGYIEVERFDSHGRSTKELKSYYGSGDYAVAKEKEKLEKEGHKNIQINEKS